MSETSFHHPRQESSSSFTDVEIEMGDTDYGTTTTATTSQPSTTTLHLRWTNLEKSVEIKEDKQHNQKGGKRVTPDQHKKKTTTTTTKVILDKVSGEARPGEILATMGPSGSGKTSLMNVLSGRAVYQDGSITINGKILDKTGMKKLMSKVAYVKQQDIFFETLTVKEQLTYTARLRIPESVGTKAERNEIISNEVNRIIGLLKLTKVAQSPINMCSGGEKKRVNIGTELLTNPSIILLDEPTSGLDSASAVSLLEILKDLAVNQGKTIITSIHQPNSATFLNTFDKLLMLSDGHAVYFGTPSESLQYLKTQDLVCPEGYNAADHWMDILVADRSQEEDHTMKHRTITSPKFQLQQAWDNDAVAAELNIANALQAATSGITNDWDQTGNKYATSWSTQFTTLTSRALKKSQSNLFSPINLLKTLATGLTVGIVYLNQKYTEQNIFNIAAFFFFATMYWVMNGMFEALFAFPLERVVVLKERATASYRLSAYYLAMTVADLPVFLAMPFIYLVTSYWMAVPTLGFTTFCGVLCVVLLCVFTGQGLGQFVGAAFDDIKIGQAVASVVIMFLVLLGGFFARNIPVWLSWVRFISPFSYASNATMRLIFRKEIPCDGSGAVCTTSEGSIHPQAVFDQFEVFWPLWANIVALLILCCIPRIAAYSLLRQKKAGERE